MLIVVLCFLSYIDACLGCATHNAHLHFKPGCLGSCAYAELWVLDCHLVWAYECTFVLLHVVHVCRS